VLLSNFTGLFVCTLVNSFTCLMLLMFHLYLFTDVVLVKHVLFNKDYYDYYYYCHH